MISAPEAEKAVLGSWLIEKEAISACIDILAPEAFAEQQNAAIARIILDLYRQGKAVDMVTVGQAAQEAGISFPGFGTYLADLAHSCTTAAHASHYAKKVLDCFYTRQLIAAAKAVADKAETETLDEPAVKALSELVMRKEAVYAPAAFTYSNGLVDFRHRMDVKSKKELFRTGFQSLDSAWYGAGTGEVITIALATNVGKSVTMLNIANKMLSRNVRCGYAGSEMDADEVVQRHLAMVSHVPAYKLRLGKLELGDIQKLNDALSGKMASMPMAILDHPEPSIADLNNFAMSTNCEVLFVDYLGRCKYPKASEERLAIGEFMKSFKTMTRRRNITSFIAAQLSRRTYDGRNLKPTLADLSETKKIEEESDKVLLGYVDPMKQKGDGDTVISFINAKNRQGKKGQEFDLILDGKTLVLKEPEIAAA
jgi:replicative DNA helicase